jgi:hypothetical protein
MGTKRDMRRRMKRLRKDDERHQRQIKAARALIFQKGASVDGTRVRNILNEESLVPTQVRYWPSHFR